MNSNWIDTYLKKVDKKIYTKGELNQFASQLVDSINSRLKEEGSIEAVYYSKRDHQFVFLDCKLYVRINEESVTFEKYDASGENKESSVTVTNDLEEFTVILIEDVQEIGRFELLKDAYEHAIKYLLLNK